jgi:U6 snRNA-associated Sm-like protein LSm1
MEYAVRVSFADFLDELVVVILRDARIFVGRLVSFDHFLNLVVDQTYERIIVGNKYAEVKRGVFVIRGENVVHIGLVVRVIELCVCF